MDTGGPGALGEGAWLRFIGIPGPLGGSGGGGKSRGPCGCGPGPWVGMGP